MIIKITWFKESGKYYSDGEVDVGENLLWEPKFKQAIVNNQITMTDGWQDNDFFVMTDSLHESHIDRNYRGFYTQLFMPHSFKGYVKS